MTYQEEEQTRLRRQYSKQAIALAMEGRWREAVAANEGLIQSFPDDVDAYNRLGRARIELGEYALAKEAYEKALQLDPYNTIASKNLNRLSHLQETTVEAVSTLDRVEPQQFIEEVGKAGVVNLHRLAAPEVLARNVAGSRVVMRREGQRLVVEDIHGEYLGQVEPRHAQRLIKLMEGGNRYAATVVSSIETAVTVIIREVYQHPSQMGQPSFPSRGTEAFRPYISDRIGDRMIRRQLEFLEFEEGLPGETGYAIVDEDETDMGTLAEESEDIDDESEREG